MGVHFVCPYLKKYEHFEKNAFDVFIIINNVLECIMGFFGYVF